MDDVQRIDLFYSGKLTNASGHTIKEIWEFDDKELERQHDFIQWLFPNPVASEFSSFIGQPPLLTPESAKMLKDRYLKEVVVSFDTMLDFYGFRRTAKGIERVSEPRMMQWLRHKNHNYRRISRILIFLYHLGLKDWAAEFLRVLEDLAKTDAGEIIGRQTLEIWRRAAMEGV